MPNKLKALLAKKEPAIGSWIGFADPFSVEIMADVGFDWLMVDTEHCPIGPESLCTILISMKGGVSSPVVRLPSNSPDYFKLALDLGAEGVVVPMINSGADAALAVRHCRYPPVGARGFSPIRASKYFQDLENYVREADGEIALVVQIETPEAVANINEILAMDGIDAIFIGPSDLASFMGCRGRTDAPEVQQAVSAIIEAAVAKGMPYGLPTWSAAECFDFIRRGALLPTLGGDLHYLSSGARSEVARVRGMLNRPAPRAS